MWLDRVFLPAYSNREDFLLTVGIYDDDTGSPINLSGVTGSGTFASWTVSTSALAGLPGSVASTTTSTTSSTIGSGTKTLTVGTGLSILATQPVTITNGSNSMFGTVTSYNSSSGVLVVQVGMAFQFEIRTLRPHFDGSGYIPWYDWGTPNDNNSVLKASVGNGISILDLGIIQIEILESTFRQLTHLTYRASLTMFDGRSTRQVFEAKLPILYGGVAT